MNRRMLTREDEASTGREEREVRREDQDKINRFSLLHQRETRLEEELKAKQVSERETLEIGWEGLKHKLTDGGGAICPPHREKREKEDLDEISSELELADDDEKIQYKIGDSFMLLPLTEVQDLLVDSTAKIDSEVSGVEDRLSTIREEMEQLKVDLYARFGTTINLES